MFRRREPRLEIKTPQQLQLMRRAGLVVAETLELVRGAVRPGVTTIELDAVAEDAIRSRAATPSFLGYHGYPATLCISVDEEIVHGIPGERVLADGDIVSIDCGAIVDGWHGDAAITVTVGAAAPEVLALSEVTEQALWAAIAGIGLGSRVGDIGRLVEQHVRAAGSYGIIEEYVGHGIGSRMHLPPDVPNYGQGGSGPEIVPGLALAIEPMVTLGSPANRTLEDDWTVVTVDGSWAAHWEHTVTWTESGPWVLTALDGGVARLG